jgi:hypothetical protein
MPFSNIAIDLGVVFLAAALLMHLSISESSDHLAKARRSLFYS